VRVLVTGAAGFVGKHLLPALQAAGHEVSGCDVEVDVSDADAVRARVATAAPDAIVHLAAVTSVAFSAREPDLTRRVNVGGTRCVLEAAREVAPGCRVLFVASGDVYGTREPGAEPFDEQAPLRPGSPYAVSKAEADTLAARFAREGLDVVRARAFNHTGPGQSTAFVVPSFAQQIAEIASGARPAAMRVGNLDSVRDFLDVADVVDAYTRLLDPEVQPGAYNIASGSGRRIGDLLDRLLKLAGVAPEIEVDPARLRPTDWAIGDATRLRAATGWSPRVDFDETLARVFRNAQAACAAA
jgi:GDP-4-dehydro-6-deoxy-D-mannose reductase